MAPADLDPFSGGGMTDLRLARFHKGLDLAEAAAELQISVSYLSLIERRKAIPRASIAQRIADFYGVTIMDTWPDLPVEEAAA